MVVPGSGAVDLPAHFFDGHLRGDAVSALV